METTQGNNWHVIVARMERAKIVPFMTKFFAILSEENLPHFTIRAALDPDGMFEEQTFMFSFRYYKTQLIIDQAIQNALEGLKILYEWLPSPDSPWYKYHAWIELNREDPKRDLKNCMILMKLSKLAYDILSIYQEDPDRKIETTHLLCNMIGLKETIYTKYIESFKRPIIGPGYSDLDKTLRYNEGIYYADPYSYEKVALNFVHNSLVYSSIMYKLISENEFNDEKEKVKKKSSKKKSSKKKGETEND